MDMTTSLCEVLPNEVVATRREESESACWSGVLAMTLCIFALIASEFMPVSLLTPMAAGLHVTAGMAGDGIAISGAFAVITSLCIAGLAGSMNRKTSLLGLTGVMALSGAVIALAPNYVVYLVGRALIGIVIGGYWSMSTATAMRLVPANRLPRALAIFNGGNAVATVVAPPLGSYLGGIIGWRGAFLCLVPVAAIAFGWQWISLPSLRVEKRNAASVNVFKLFRNPVVTWGMLAVGIFFMGQFTLFTYVRPFLETVMRVDVSTLSLILLVIGVAGFVGTVLIGTVLKRGFYRTMIAIPVVMSAIAAILIVIGDQVSTTAMLLGLWGLVATAAPVGWWVWLARTLPKDAEAGGGLMVAVIQLAIALGSTTGGLMFDTSGYQSAFMASMALLLVAAVLTLATSRRANPAQRTLDL